ncbi:MAG TPA: dihydrofolate reductase family protein [Amycolatopsis sp.]|nr:dihydrofolate reductase family protein [Amycolatopsis sp.]
MPGSILIPRAATSPAASGGATLAAEVAALGLIDEYRARVYPVLVGGEAISPAMMGSCLR